MRWVYCALVALACSTPAFGFEYYNTAPSDPVLHVPSFSRTGRAIDLDRLQHGEVVYSFPHEVSARLRTSGEYPVRIPPNTEILFKEIGERNGVVTLQAVALVQTGDGLSAPPLIRRRSELPRPIAQGPAVLYEPAPLKSEPVAQIERPKPREMMVTRPMITSSSVPTVASSETTRLYGRLQLLGNSLQTEERAFVRQAKLNLLLSEHFGLTGEYASAVGEHALQPMGQSVGSQRYLGGVMISDVGSDRFGLDQACISYGSSRDSSRTSTPIWQMSLEFHHFLGFRHAVVADYYQCPSSDLWLRTRSEHTLCRIGATELSLGGQYVNTSYKLVKQPGWFYVTPLSTRYFTSQGGGYLSLTSQLGRLPFRFLAGGGARSDRSKYLEGEFSVTLNF